MEGVQQGGATSALAGPPSGKAFLIYGWPLNFARLPTLGTSSPCLKPFLVYSGFENAFPIWSQASEQTFLVPFSLTHK